ncbi:MULTISPECIES: DUF7127 family protein [Halomicrobium]|uniref:Hsp20/alpha crystallin family protein n=2 Tax=Halomicrobium mukohataei TaxID=57705 RepID=C7NW71_HALMD|nr:MULTISPECIES: hypothetical protein [Halomicrobium]ACV48200.1 conserved hypothetical protein [Halomicrobium mukohataei DSM 12286]QCD66623.1 hypothetical protein E5139_13585 [Halomicrobium mukohataei]QFR21429.1 hypothetical protein GBQ70_13600 [Halomicrobium sp. ZPS1]
MTDQQQLVGDAPLRRYEYDDAVVLAADIGVTDDATVDVVDDTAIVVVGDEQYDFDLPAGDARAFIRNGVLTVEMSEVSH